MHSSFDWDDLRVFLAVAREGSLSGAARALSVNHSTVFRRLNGLEGRLDVRLFERLSGGYVLTPAGDALSQSADRVEAEILAAERALRGRDLRLRGGLRVTMPDTISRLLLPVLIAPFERRYPEIELELVISDTFLNLSKRDADVAIRPSSTPPDTLIGRRVSAIATAIYGARTYLKTAPPIDDLDAHAWIAPDDSLAELPSARWLRARLKQAQLVFRTNTLMGMLAAARAGLGLAALPCFLGDAAEELQRVLPPQGELVTELWLLVHRDLRHVARVRAFLDHADRELRRLHPAFDGSGAV